MRRTLLALFSAIALLVLSASAQVVPEGTKIRIRTIERIDSNNADGRVFQGTVDENVVDLNGNLIIPRGAPVELIARRSGSDLVIDLDSVIVNGHRYAVAATPIDKRAGIGKNTRTAKFVGGTALVGTIIGALAGGGKGAAIGAVSGAGVGAGTQMITRGHALAVPSESVLTFRLERPLVVDVADKGYTRNGHHYHREY
jgi:hypothetical protein